MQDKIDDLYDRSPAEKKRSPFIGISELSAEESAWWDKLRRKNGTIPVGEVYLGSYIDKRCLSDFENQNGQISVPLKDETESGDKSNYYESDDGAFIVGKRTR